MKKLIFIIAVIASLLIGCTSSNISSSSKGDLSNENSIVNSEISSQYNVTVTTRQEGAMGIYPGAEGIYFAAASNGNAISYYDEKSGVTTALCNRPECPHNDDSCNAYMSKSIYNLFMNTDKTKLFIQYIDDYIDASTWNVQHIQMCDINGENRREIYKSGETSLGRDFAFSGDDMFFIAETIDKETSASHDVLIKLNCQTREQSTMQAIEENAKIVGGYDNFILIDLSVGDFGTGGAKIIKYK